MATRRTFRTAGAALVRGGAAARVAPAPAPVAARARRRRARHGGALARLPMVPRAAFRMSFGVRIAIMADVHHMQEAAMRVVACLTLCLMPIMANAAQTNTQAQI